MSEETVAVPLHPKTRRGTLTTLTRSSITIPSSKQSSGNLRRNCTGKPNPSNAGEKTIPNHLRASTGSCHDHCKYGHKRSFEVEEKKHIPTRIPTISVPAKLKVSSDSKTHSPNSPEIIKREIKLGTSSKQKPTNIKKRQDKNEMNIISSTKHSVVKSKGTKPALLTEKKQPSSLVKVLMGSSGNRKSDVIQLGKMLSPTAAKKVKAPTISLSPKSSLSLNQSKPRSVKVGPGPPLNSQNLTLKTDREQKRRPLNAQNLILKTDREQTGPPLNAQNPILGTERGPPLEAQNLILETDREQTLTDSVLEKTLHVVEAENKNEDNLDSEFTDTETENDFESEDEIIDNDRVQGKVKFRRGCVVDLECENNSLRTLSFRQRRILGDNEVGKADVRRKIKNRGSDESVNCSGSSSSNKSGKVVSRHEDGREKKDGHGLFNNVIEETANKLVKVRKSKVKALVGAFETVISLQEKTNKPSTRTARLHSAPNETSLCLRNLV